MFFSIISRKKKIKVPNKNCNCFEIDSWELSEFVIKTLVPVVGIRPFPLNEQILLSAAMLRFNPDYVIEWGTNIGKSARIFYETKKYFGLKSKIYSIDLPEDVEHNEHPHKDRGKLVRGMKEVKLLLGDGLDKAEELLDKFGHDANVLFFLDGDHTYGSVYRELSLITKKYKNAKILVHDTFYQEDKSGYNIGPYKAVKKVVDINIYNFIIENIGLPGMTLLWRK